MILLIIFGSSLFCYAIERHIAWISHVSSVCLLILFAMLLSQIGIVPAHSELYDFLQAPIVLLAIAMVTLDFKFSDFIRLPLKIIFVFIFGMLGSILGGLIAGFTAAHELGVDSYKIAAQLTASYIGGLENAAAMQKLLEIPNHYFIGTFALDSVVTSFWLIICIWFANDKGEEFKIADDDGSNFDGVQVSIVSLLACLFVALGIVILAEYAVKYVGFMHKILWISIFALFAGQTPILKDYFKSAYVLGAILFAGFFFSIGAVSDLQAILNLPKTIIMMPVIIIFTHSLFILISARLFKLNKIATSIISQALIGGPGTAVALAQTRKWKSGIAIGIILGVLGYSIANFFGVFVFNLLQYILPK
ncbi:DUF819 family protein [Fluviispira multicolorata]|nr:DUF819 family protein [Fluviispira multicolorata]